MIADILVQLESTQRRMEKADNRMTRADKKNDLIIRRLVKGKARTERHDNRMELFDQKLEKSIEDQKDSSAMQSELNQYFLNISETQWRKIRMSKRVLAIVEWKIKQKLRKFYNCLKTLWLNWEKKSELIKAKENYHRLCREFIDLWSARRRAQRGAL